MQIVAHYSFTFTYTIAETYHETCTMSMFISRCRTSTLTLATSLVSLRYTGAEAITNAFPCFLQFFNTTVAIILVLTQTILSFSLHNVHFMKSKLYYVKNVVSAIKIQGSRGE